MEALMEQPVSVPAFINLGDAVSSSRTTILTGKPRGLAAREALRVDEIYANNVSVVIVVPQNVVGITSSFTNGFLGGAIVASGGLRKFLLRLQVKGPPRIIQSMIRDLQQGDLPPLRLSE